MAEARDGSYVWVTWIVGLLAGEVHCEWAAWFRAHYMYQRRQSGFDFAVWRAEHAEIVRSRVATLKNSGYSVYVEEQNKFRLPGNTTILGGAPDIVAIRGSESLVIDCKTGQQRNSDYFQVLTYMLVLPYAHFACKGRKLVGEVQYKSQSQRIEPEALTNEMRGLIGTMIQRVAGRSAPPKVPSYGECRFCDIASADCLERIDYESPQGEPEHGLF